MMDTDTCPVIKALLFYCLLLAACIILHLVFYMAHTLNTIRIQIKLYAVRTYMYTFRCSMRLVLKFLYFVLMKCHFFFLRHRPIHV